MELTGSWEVCVNEQVIGIPAAIKDIKEFLGIMKVEINMRNRKKIILDINPQKNIKKGYKLSVAKDEIIISANIINFIWAGIVI